MNISFTPLAESHFPLLLKWLEASHVKAWWPVDVRWTTELIQDKYGDYVKGYKALKLPHGTVKPPIHAFIIFCENVPIGYCQFYNRHDFPSDHLSELGELPDSCAGHDWYIGELGYIGHGIGEKVLKLFLEDKIFSKYTNVLVDPDVKNETAIKVYKKAGFVIVKAKDDVVWMLKKV
jgi:aminoglycoside 6'-N-acetyltransferase